MILPTKDLFHSLASVDENMHINIYFSSSQVSSATADKMGAYTLEG